MKILIFVWIFISYINIFAQDTIYLDKKYKTISNRDQAHYLRVVKQDPDNSKQVVKQTFFKNGKFKSEVIYSNYYGKKKIVEKNTVWYENCQIHVVSNYKKGKKDGYFISYWENGQMKRKDLYKKGKLIEGKCFNISGEEVAYYDFEIQPEFPGGKNALILYLKESINYANISSSSKDQTVRVQFSIDTDGSIFDVKVVKSHDAITDYEAKRVIQNMPKWKPAIQDGKKVKVKRTVPITFK